MGVDKFGRSNLEDFNFHSKRLMNVGAPEEQGDAVNLEYLTKQLEIMSERLEKLPLSTKHVNGNEQSRVFDVTNDITSSLGKKGGKT